MRKSTVTKKSVAGGVIVLLLASDDTGERPIGDAILIAAAGLPKTGGSPPGYPHRSHPGIRRKRPRAPLPPNGSIEPHGSSRPGKFQPSRHPAYGSATARRAGRERRFG